MKNEFNWSVYISWDFVTWFCHERGLSFAAAATALKLYRFDWPKHYLKAAQESEAE